VKILIDFTQIPLQKTGVGIYGYHLIRNLIENDKENTYLVVLQSDETCFDDLVSRRFILIRIRCSLFRRLILRMLFEQIALPFIARKRGAGIVHSLHYSFPLLPMKAKKVVTVHDMTFFLFPKLHLVRKRIYFRFFISRASRQADMAITDSLSTAKDFMERFRVDESRVATVYLGKDDRFECSSSPNEENIAEAKARYGITGDYLLYMGTIEPRKNIMRIVSSFHRVANKRRDLLLVIAGKPGWHHGEILDSITRREPGNRVRYIGFVDEQDKPCIIAGARIFIYPSLYEGFGIPVLESLACGVPTITSNVSSLPEIAGDAALCIDPYDENEIYEAIEKLLDDKKLYNTLRVKSTQRASIFSWEKTAAETIAVYKKLVL